MSAALACVIGFSACTTTDHGQTAATAQSTAHPRRGADTDSELGNDVVWSPFLIAFAPLGLVALGFHEAANIGVKRIYLPPGLSRNEVKERINAAGSSRIPGIFESVLTKNGNEYWTVKKDKNRFYARFHDGVTIEYRK